jgi:hypothetical protein
MYSLLERVRSKCSPVYRTGNTGGAGGRAKTLPGTTVRNNVNDDILTKLSVLRAHT